MTQTAVLRAGTAGMLSGPFNATGMLMSLVHEFGHCWYAEQQEVLAEDRWE